MNIKKYAQDILADCAGSFLMAVGIYCFAEKVDIAPGGVSGIAIMLKAVFGFPVGMAIFMMNIPLLTAAYKFIGKRFALRTVRTLIINTSLLDMVVTKFLPQYSGDRLLGSLFGGIFIGIGLGLIFLRGSSTAGTDIISYLVERKYPQIQMGKALMAVDCVILGASGFVFGNIDSVLYGFVALFCQTVIIDKIVYGAEKGRNVMIISEKSQEIAKRIMNEKARGATFLKAEGAYSGKESKVLMCVIRRWEYHDLKEIIYDTDANAFVITTEAEQIMGEGFSKIRAKRG